MNQSIPTPTFQVDEAALKALKLVAVSFSKVNREDFATQGAYEAEVEVEERAEEVIAAIVKMGIPVKGYPADQYFFTNILVDKPDLVVNLADTVKGKDSLQPAIPGALELSNIQYTGAGLKGLVVGNDRHLFKQLLLSLDIPTPDYKLIRDLRSNVPTSLGFPLIVKLNESGGSVGIDNKAVKETLESVEKKVKKMIETYKIPVIVEKFENGPEITCVVFDDGRKKHVFLGEKKFRLKPDGKYDFTSLESYEDAKSYSYKIPDQAIQDKINPLAVRAFDILGYRDYAKFDIRYNLETGTPYFIDCNPNTALGPDKGLPMTEVLALHGIDFLYFLKSLISKHARKIQRENT